MPKSRVRKKAKANKAKNQAANAARSRRLKQMESWYKELDQIENQAIANLVDRAAVEEGETQNEAVSRPVGEDSEGGGGQGGPDGGGDP